MLETKTYTYDGVDFVVPATMDDNAAYIAYHKYARLVNGNRESSWFAIADRISSVIFATDPDKSAKLSNLIASQKWAPNSPVFFNVGIKEEPQISACFIVRVDDSFDGDNGIWKWWETSGRIFRGGSGMGANLGRMREKGAFIAGGGVSSGPLSFAAVADAIGSATKSGGVTRRAATMLTLPDTHPDLVEFIEQKSKTERAIRSLRDAGLGGGSLNDDIYSLILHQQANRAVWISDAFMDAVEADGIWELVSPYDGRVTNRLPARELLRTIARSTWEAGDPGLAFSDTINEWHTLPATDRIWSSNPCSEYVHLDNSSCNLSSFNLLAYYDEVNDSFDFESFVSDIALVTEAMDSLVTLGGFPTEEIKRNTQKYRPLGIGFANLGGLLMSMGIAYDSHEGRRIAAALAALITLTGYSRSARLADEFGSYCETEPENHEATINVLWKHVDNASELEKDLISLHNDVPSNFYQRAFDAVYEAKCGLSETLDNGGCFRNSQISVIAPTGTISFVMGCATTGIEPAFATAYEKELVGGDRITVALPTIASGMRALGYGTDETKRALFSVRNKRSMVGLVSDEHLPVFQTAVDPLGNYVSPEAHIKMMAAVQRYVSGAISKTVNLPSSATIEDMERSIRLSWSLGVKAVAFYRDASKAAQPHRVVKTEYCNGCGAEMVQTGSCFACPNCGDTSGVCS